MAELEILNLIKEQNDKDHTEIKTDIQYIKNIIAPKVAGNESAIKIILAIIIAAGFLTAIADSIFKAGG